MADEKTAGNTSPEESLQQAIEHARAINEQILQTAAKAGREMLDGYVRWLEQVAEQQRKIASGPPVSQVDWLWQALAPTSATWACSSAPAWSKPGAKPL